VCMLWGTAHNKELVVTTRVTVAHYNLRRIRSFNFESDHLMFVVRKIYDHGRTERYEKAIRHHRALKHEEQPMMKLARKLTRWTRRRGGRS
jgi:hypothetical protein